MLLKIFKKKKMTNFGHKKKSVQFNIYNIIKT
jgi:hypothetical protein